MAANRLGFLNLFAALTDKAPMSLSEGGERWVSLAASSVCPAYTSNFAAAQANDQFQIMSIMRSECPKLEPLRLHGQAMVAVLNEIQQGIDGLFALLEEEDHKQQFGIYCYMLKIMSCYVLTIVLKII